MPSKGIELYTYITVPDVTVRFSVPGGSVTHSQKDNFAFSHLEVESKDIPGLTHFTGRFEFVVLLGDRELTTQWNDINTLVGKLEDGSMKSSKDQVSVILEDVDAIISYGFYSAGHGEVGLTNLDQCYVTVVSYSAHCNWMSRLVPAGSEAEKKSFSRFALAAPHDDGMNSMETVDKVLEERNEDLIHKLADHIPAISWLLEHMTHNAVTESLPNLVYGLAITQKDPISTLLATGARYFEFRPAMLLPEFQGKHPDVPNRHYFQHACIPGLAFEEFLEQLVEFLDTHPEEHVVTHIRSDNIVSQCKQPTPEELDAAYNEAVSRSTNGLKWGDASYFKHSVADLRSENRRLLRVIEADKYDSWTAKAYATLLPEPIIAQFESMNTEGQEATDITVLQCQATSQSIKEVLVHSILTCNTANSCLTSTKARLDRTTLPWIRQHAFERLKAEKLIVVMNDFLEGATTDTVIELSKQRFAEP